MQIKLQQTIIQINQLQCQSYNNYNQLYICFDFFFSSIYQICSAQNYCCSQFINQNSVFLKLKSNVEYNGRLLIVYYCLHQINFMKHTHDTTYHSQTLRQTKRPRKLSLRHQSFSEWQQVNQLDDLKTIAAYINSNIQSKRRNIMNIYATSITVYEKMDSNNLILNNPFSNKRNMHRRIKKDVLEPLSPTLKNVDCQNKQQTLEPDFIVSNRFSAKVEKVKIPSIQIRSHSPILKKKAVSMCKESLSKETAASQWKIDHSRMEVSPLSKKAQKVTKSKNRSHQLGDSINPWEYLVMAHENSLSQL